MGTGEATSCQRAAGSVPLLSTSHRISWAAIKVSEPAPCVGRFSGSFGATGDHDTRTHKYINQFKSLVCVGVSTIAVLNVMSLL